MTIKITSTKDSALDGVKCLVYGKSGIGKTVLMATAPKPIILSAEAGLLSLADIDIPAIEVKTIQDIYDAKEFLIESDEAKQYETICLDSITEVGEVLLSAFKERSRDARGAYGDLADEMAKLIREFRDIKGRNIIFSAKHKRVTDDDTGITSYFAAMPGKTLLDGLPFFFDEVFHMTFMQDDNGVNHRVLKTEAGIGHDAKDRSGKLSSIEEPNLTKIINKITGAE